MIYEPLLIKPPASAKRLPTHSLARRRPCPVLPDGRDGHGTVVGCISPGDSADGSRAGCAGTQWRQILFARPTKSSSPYQILLTSPNLIRTTSPELESRRRRQMQRRWQLSAVVAAAPTQRRQLFGHGGGGPYSTATALGLGGGGPNSATTALGRGGGLAAPPLLSDAATGSGSAAVLFISNSKQP